MRRRTVLTGIGALALLGGGGWWLFGRRRGPEIGFTLDEDELAAARRLMAAHPVVDAHAHPGRTFLRDGKGFADWKIRAYALFTAGFEDEAVADMKTGGVDAAVFNGVGDVLVLKLGDGGLTAARDFAPGEAWQSYRTQIANLRALEERGLVRICTTPDDVLAAKREGRTGAILAMEGADFLDGDAGRLAQVHADGIRMLTLVHYRDNAIGHIMTGTHTEEGLTGFGREVVVACNEAGIMLDAAHASMPTAWGMLEASRAPVAFTHTHINTPELQHPRFIDADLARAAAAKGGYIGAWPAGIGMTSLREFVERIEWLLDTVGEDAVALGSDMDANYRPVLETYRKMPLVIGALLAHGRPEAQVVKFMGGNVLRMWRAVEAAAG